MFNRKPFLSNNAGISIAINAMMSAFMGGKAHQYRQRSSRDRRTQKSHGGHTPKWVGKGNMPGSVRRRQQREAMSNG